MERLTQIPKQVQEEMSIIKMELCKTCPLLRPESRCGGCGCSLSYIHKTHHKECGNPILAEKRFGSLVCHQDAENYYIIDTLTHKTHKVIKK